MPAAHPTIALPVDNSQHCLLTLEHVDALNRHAHRIVLYGHLIANVLESDWERPEKNTLLEGVAEVVETMIADAEAIEALMVRGTQAVPKGGA